MLLSLFRLATRAVLRSAGARAVRHAAGPVELAAYRTGRPDGEPWVLLHGLGSTALSWWRVAPALAARGDVWIPELSALGGTRAPHGGLNVREGVAAIGDLIERRIGRPVSLAGISLGGWMAARLAIERPEQVERLVLVDAAGYLEQDWERIRRLITVERLADVDRLHGALFQRPPWWMRRVRRGFLAAYRSPPVRHVLETVSREDALSDDELASIGQPVTLVWGERDRLFPLAVGRAMARALPDARLVVLPGCGHAVQWESPLALRDALVEAGAESRGGRRDAATAPMEVAEWPDPST